MTELTLWNDQVNALTTGESYTFTDLAKRCYYDDTYMTTTNTRILAPPLVDAKTEIPCDLFFVTGTIQTVEIMIQVCTVLCYL